MPQETRFGFKTLSSIVCVIAALAYASVASAQQRSDQLRRILKVQQSVVRIEVFKDGKQLSTGCGFVVDSKGLIVTNYHVIQGAEEVKVSFPMDPGKEKYTASGFTAADKGKDLALVKIDPKEKKLPLVTLAKAEPTQGELVVVLGAPGGLQSAITTGILSAIRSGEEVHKLHKEGKRDVYKDVLGYDDDLTWIQHSAAISPGAAGGPLVNGQGEVVGINTFTYMRGANVNFALSAKDIQKFMDAAEEKVQPFADLPKPRRRKSTEGDSERQQPESPEAEKKPAD